MIPEPQPPTPDEMAKGGPDQCRAETRIDREGMNDARCGLRTGHPGTWHYIEPRRRDDEMWFRPGNEK